MTPYKNIISLLKTYINFRIISEQGRFFLTLGLILIYLLFWAGFSALLNTPFSIIAIFELHHHFIVWFFDLIIASIPIATVFFLNYREQSYYQLKDQVNSLKNKVSSNKLIVDEIRKGKFKDLDTSQFEASEELMSLGIELDVASQKEKEQKWISKGREIVNDLLRTYRTIDELSYVTIKAIIEYMDGIQGSFYLLEKDKLKNIATYAFNRRRFINQEVKTGHGLVGAVAFEKTMIYRTEIPDDYFSITSGILGDVKPKSLIIIPLLQEDELQGVIEIAAIKDHIPNYQLEFAEQLVPMIGRTIYALKINATTELLLKESQEMTLVLKENEETLRKNAREMMTAQQELEQSNELLETQIQEVENGQKRLSALLTNASEFISIYNENQNLVFESPSVKRILGYNDDDEISGMDPDMLTPRGYRTINNLFKYLLQTPGGESIAQYTYLKKNGEKLFLETKGKNLLHDTAIKGIIFNTQDITERKRAEKEERMKSRMQSLSENSPDMIMRINTVGKLVYINPAVVKFIGVEIADIIKKRVNEIKIDQRFIDFVVNSLSKFKQGESLITEEVEMESPQGEKIMQIKGIAETNDDGDLESVMFVAHDMTEIKKIEQEVKEKNKKISDSINYAQRIQTAILPDSDLIQKYFPRSFMFYRPKDIVSGDFPWFVKKDETYYIAAVDCTGHGVPGALLSFIGYFLLNNTVSLDNNYTASTILETLHQGVRTTLKQNDEGSNARDGMDLALCKIDKSKKELQFAGAHNPLYLLRDGELIEYKGTRKGIGGKPLLKKKEKEFENHIIPYQDGDKIFIFSDGLPDQLGGPLRKKYQSKRIREALTENKEHTMAHFARHFSEDFYNWMGDVKQVDDVLLIGIEL